MSATIRKQSGFTLIELVVVIVILGILAAVAVPKYVDLSGEAKNASAAGMAGALGSAMAINYAACKAIGGTSAGKCVAVTACDDLTSTLQANTTGFTVGGTFPSCTVSGNGVTVPATFTGIGAP